MGILVLKNIFTICTKLQLIIVNLIQIVEVKCEEGVTTEEFVIAAHDTATNLINRSDFPADVETLSITFGLIFNYWGRRSFCKMYAIDYVENVDNEAIKKCKGKKSYKGLDVLMDG